jgi:hypothetical protein
MKCIILLCCSAVVTTFYRVTDRVYLHDVFMMLVRVEGAHEGEGGAPGQHTWHTRCPFLINRNKLPRKLGYRIVRWGRTDTV